MRITILQPPYPHAGTSEAASTCLAWMSSQFDALIPEAQDLLLLPEYATTPGLEHPQGLRSFSLEQGAAFERRVAEVALKLRCLIVLPTVRRINTQWFNRTIVYDKEGQEICHYDKIHLTDAESSKLKLTPGTAQPVFTHWGLRFGFAACFDIYFPEHFITLADKGVDLILCPSYQRSETAERIRSLCKVRAVDSGAYLLRSSYAMPSPITTGGHTLVAAPDACLLAGAEQQACVLSIEIDPKKKFIKPSSYGAPPVEHRALITTHRHTARASSLVNMTRPFPWVCAHRGLSKACPENTLVSFAAAIAAGAQEIEFDIRMTCDGVLAVCHDETVDRTTNGYGRIEDLSWAEIRRLDAGEHVHEVWRGTRIPRLEEVLHLVGGQVGLNIHIKDSADGGVTVRKVCDLLRANSLTDRAYLALDCEDDLQMARDYAPEIARACLVRQNQPRECIAIARHHACQRIQLFRNATSEDISHAHEAGLICNLFHSDEIADAQEFVRKGIDVILTNCALTLISNGFLLIND